jgi:hypothetical protein
MLCETISSMHVTIWGTARTFMGVSETYRPYAALTITRGIDRSHHCRVRSAIAYWLRSALALSI